MNRIPCKCGAVCDDYGDGIECSGDVIAVSDSPCPRHRCAAHCHALGIAASEAAVEMVADMNREET